MKASGTENVGYYELKQHKPWFDENYSTLLDQRKQANLQWLHNPSQTNSDNVKSVKRGSSRTLRKRYEMSKRRN
jgi:hypothetical protein